MGTITTVLLLLLCFACWPVMLVIMMAAGMLSAIVFVPLVAVLAVAWLLAQAFLLPLRAIGWLVSGLFGMAAIAVALILFSLKLVLLVGAGLGVGYLIWGRHRKSLMCERIETTFG